MLEAAFSREGVESILQILNLAVDYVEDEHLCAVFEHGLLELGDALAQLKIGLLQLLELGLIRLLLLVDSREHRFHHAPHLCLERKVRSIYKHTNQ